MINSLHSSFVSAENMFLT